MRIVPILMFLTFPLYAQAPVQSPAAVFQAALTAHGGTALSAVNTITISGTSTTASGTNPVYVSANLDGRLRVDYGDPASPQKSIVQTTVGQTVLSGGKLQGKPPHVDLFAQLDWLSVFGLQYLNVVTVLWSDVGADLVGGRATHVLRANNGQQKTFYGRAIPNQVDIDVDVQTALIARVRRQQRSDNSLDFIFTVSYVFSDYRTVGDIIFPFRIEKDVNAQAVETIVVQDVQWNPVLPNGLFER